MKNNEYVIHAFWDEDSSVWVAESEDIDGLVTEADSIELLRDKLRTLVPELLELNHQHPHGKISYCIKTDFHETICS
ncbi:MAG: DUF1902 domain-containing protein [Spirochaetota bacterium]|nr:DUF1902 domain-containing protein [Spirochaetota bacterium]